MDFLGNKIISVRAITPDIYEKLQNITVIYYCNESPFGKYLAAFLETELCYLGFYDVNIESCLKQLQMLFKNAHIKQGHNPMEMGDIKLLLKGTEFEVAVWRELLKIEKGTTVNYNYIAEAIGKPKSYRAVGNAVGKNHIPYIIPCHRVVRKNGQLGGFSCGTHRKIMMLNYEGIEFY